MTRKPHSHAAGVTRRSFTAGAGALALLAGTAPFNIVRAAGGPLKVGVLLPRSGFEAGIGQDCQRGVDIAGPILKDIGLPDLEIINGDTELSVEVARTRAEKMINDGAQLLVGAFDSGQTAAIAQVAEQKGIPFVINIAAAPAITEQGYKFVFRNFPTAPMILGDAFGNQKAIFGMTGAAPKTAVFMHVNDTFGTAMAKGVGAVMPHFDMPYKIVEEISYDPAAKDLSVEVAKAKAANAEILLLVSRLNDAILLTRELVKQRWTPEGDLQHGSGLVRGPVSEDAGQARRRSDQLRALVRPEQEAHRRCSRRALAKAYPDVNLNTNHIFTFEALLVAADAYKRAGSTDPGALAEAIRATNITDNVSIGPGISFNAKGQNDKVKDGAIQNAGGKLVTIAPAEAANAKPVWPMPDYSKR